MDSLIKFTIKDMINFASRYVDDASDMTDKWWVEEVNNYTKYRDRDNAIKEFIKQYDIDNKIK